MELDQQIRTYTRVAGAFQPLELPALPSPHDDEKTSQQKIEAFRVSYANFVQSLERVQPPLAVPLKTNIEGQAEPQWQSYARLDRCLHRARLLAQTPDPALTHLESIFVAYSRKDAKEFNKQVAEYHRLLQRDPPPELKTEAGFASRLFGSFYAFEAYFNHVAVLPLGRAVPDRLRPDSQRMARLEQAAQPGSIPAGSRHGDRPYTGLDRTHLHLRAAAGHQSVLVGRLHRLGRRGDGNCLRVALPQRHR